MIDIFKSDLEKAENEVLKINGIIDSKMLLAEKITADNVELDKKRIEAMVNNELEEEKDNTNYSKKIANNNQSLSDLKAVIKGLKERRVLATCNLRKVQIANNEKKVQNLDKRQQDLERECDELAKQLKEKQIEFEKNKLQLYKIGCMIGRTRTGDNIYSSLTQLRDEIDNPLFLGDRYAIIEIIQKIDEMKAEKNNNSEVNYEDYNVNNFKICTDKDGRVSYYTPFEDLDIS